MSIEPGTHCLEPYKITSFTQQIKTKEYTLENLTLKLKYQKLDKHKLTDKNC